jgi:hypothetical protein
MGDHPKWVCLSTEAFKVGVLLTCWAQKQAQLKRPTRVRLPLVEKFSGKSNASKIVKELEDAGKPDYDHGLLDPVDGGWEVHDLHQYLPNVAKMAEGGRKGAATRWGNDGQTQ